MSVCRTERLTFLRYQIRTLKRRQRMLQALLGKDCDALHAEAQNDLEKTAIHLAGAERALELSLTAKKLRL